MVWGGGNVDIWRSIISTWSLLCGDSYQYERSDAKYVQKWNKYMKSMEVLARAHWYQQGFTTRFNVHIETHNKWDW